MSYGRRLQGSDIEAEIFRKTLLRQEEESIQQRKLQVRQEGTKQVKGSVKKVGVSEAGSLRVRVWKICQ